MSIEQLKAALARKKAGKGSEVAGKDITGSGSRSINSQVTSKRPAKKSAGRGR